MSYCVGMYIRTVQRKNRDGSIVRHVQLAHNFRHPQTGRPQAKVLWSFGREEEVDREQLQRLIRSIERFLSPEEALRRQAQEGDVPLRFVESRPLGGGWVLDRLWHELGIAPAIQEAVADRRVRLPVERALSSPSGWNSITSTGPWTCWWRPVRRCRRPFTGAWRTSCNWRSTCCSWTLLFLDTTTTYFEVDETDDEQGLRHYSQRSTDHRPDRPQIVIGLAVTRSGLPVRCWVWPGQTTDVSRVEEVKRDLIAWKLGPDITVVDRGFVSEENLRTLQRAGGHYIVGERMRSGKAGVEQALSRPGRYQKVRPNLEVKEIVVGTGEARSATSWCATPSRPSVTGPSGSRSWPASGRNWRAWSAGPRRSTPGPSAP